MDLTALDEERALETPDAPTLTAAREAPPPSPPAATARAADRARNASAVAKVRPDDSYFSDTFFGIVSLWSRSDAF